MLGAASAGRLATSATARLATPGNPSCGHLRHLHACPPTLAGQHGHLPHSSTCYVMPMASVAAQPPPHDERDAAVAQCMAPLLACKPPTALQSLVLPTSSRWVGKPQQRLLQARAAPAGSPHAKERSVSGCTLPLLNPCPGANTPIQAVFACMCCACTRHQFTSSQQKEIQGTPPLHTRIGERRITSKAPVPQDLQR